MRWVRFRSAGGGHSGDVGVLRGERVLPVLVQSPDPTEGASGIPPLLRCMQDGPPHGIPEAEGAGLPLAAVRLLAPLERPASFRDFYSFEEHVRRARSRRGLSVPEEWYRHPTFYFSNPHSVFGPEEDIPCPRVTRELDFEVELACVIGRPGRDLTVEEAAAHIAGYTLLNDWSARDVQREEMVVGLGPAKGKDFATSHGPWLLSPDELEPLRSGKGFDVELTAQRNGRQLVRGNWKTIHFSFEEMIAYASRDAWLLPGDLIGSGTIGGGSILEIGPEAAGGWLVPGDIVEIEGGPLGILRNRMVNREAGAGIQDGAGGA
jgi:fumarylacetoacetate (FAA) hydrolase